MHPFTFGLMSEHILEFIKLDSVEALEQLRESLRRCRAELDAGAKDFNCDAKREWEVLYVEAAVILDADNRSQCGHEALRAMFELRTLFPGLLDSHYPDFLDVPRDYDRWKKFVTRILERARDVAPAFEKLRSKYADVFPSDYSLLVQRFVSRHGPLQEYVDKLERMLGSKRRAISSASDPQLFRIAIAGMNAVPQWELNNLAEAMEFLTKLKKDPRRGGPTPDVLALRQWLLTARNGQSIRYPSMTKEAFEPVDLEAARLNTNLGHVLTRYVRTVNDGKQFCVMLST